MNTPELANWNTQEALAEAMIPLVGNLHRTTGVTVLLHSRSLVNKSVISILRTHRFARQIAGEELSVVETFPFLEAVAALDLGPAKIDLGLLVHAYRADERGLSVADFVAGDLKKRASLLRRDSVHGHFNGTIKVDKENNLLIANGNVIKFIYANDPSEVDYTQYGINDAILIDNTGKWRDRAGLEQHLRPGISKVVLTAPGKGDVPNIVHGVNHLGQDVNQQIFSCASCTTNAIVPPLKAMDEKFGIIRGHVETVHSFTNDQNLLDNYHKADRRGRSAPLNLTITETGAASAVAKALPELKAKITGNSIRVPTPDVSIAILSLQLKKETTKDEVLTHLRETSLSGPLSRNLDYTAATDAVSSDFIGSRAASIIDANAAIVDGDQAILYCWYDNEFGYSCQVVRVVQFLSGIEYPTYPRS